MTRGGVLAASLVVSAAVLGWHWWPKSDASVPAPDPPPAQRPWSGHELRVCREVTARATLDGPVTPAEMSRLSAR